MASCAKISRAASGPASSRRSQRAVELEYASFVTVAATGQIPNQTPRAEGCWIISCVQVAIHSVTLLAGIENCTRPGIENGTVRMGAGELLE